MTKNLLILLSSVSLYSATFLPLQGIDTPFNQTGTMQVYKYQNVDYYRYALTQSPQTLSYENNLKFFIPNFAKRIQYNISRQGSSGSLSHYISLGSEPKKTNLTLTNNIENLIAGKTYKTGLNSATNLTYFLNDTQSKQLDKWFYIEYAPIQNSSPYITSSLILLFHKTLVDNYVDTNNLTDASCNSVDTSVKKFCLYIRNINTGDTPPNTNIKISPPATSSVKACEGTGNYTTPNFTASGGTSSYVWSKVSGVGNVNGNQDKATITYNYDKDTVSSYNTTLKVENSGQSQTANYNFLVKPNLSFNVVQNIPIAINTSYIQNFENLLTCNSQSNKDKIDWSISIKVKDGDILDKSSYEFDTTTGDLNWTKEMSPQTYQITVTSKSANEASITHTYEVTITDPVAPIFKSTPNIAFTTGKNNTYDLNNLLESNVTKPVKWYITTPSQIIKDINSSTGIITVDNTKDTNQTITIVAQNSAGAKQRNIDMNITSIDPVIIDIDNSIALYALTNSNFTQDLTLKYKKLSTVWSSQYFFNDSKSGEDTKLTDIENGKKIEINNLEKGAYKINVNVIDTENYNLNDTKTYTNITLNLTVKDPIKILSIDSNVTQTCSSNYKYLVKDGDNLSIALSNPTDNLTWILKDDNAVKEFNPTPSNGKYIGKLSSGNPYDNLHDIEIKVTSDDDTSTDTKIQKFIVTQDKAYVGLLDENGNILKDNQQITLKKGVTTQFKAIGFGTPKCSITIDNPPVGTVSNNTDCSFSIPKEGDYNIAIEITPDTCTENTDIKTIKLKANIPDTNIVPILMYLLD